MKAEPSSAAIVGFDANDWTGPWMNRQQILSRLAQRGWPTWYSTGAPYRWHIQRAPDDYPYISRIERHDNVNIVRAGRLPFRWERFRIWDQLALAAHVALLRRSIARQGGNKIIAHVFNPEYSPYIDALRPDILVFHARDDFRHLGGWSVQRQQATARLAEQADLLIVSDRCMADQFPESTRNRSRELENGADATSFAQGRQQPEPDDLSQIPHPRIGYTGALSLKFDWELLLTLATTETAWQWVLIGPVIHGENTTNKNLADRCMALPNVHWLGVKSHQALPAYVAHCDVNVMLYRVSQELGAWAQSGSPLKLHEYLAAGPPVVGSAISSIERFKDVVAVPDPDDGPAAWRHALSDAIFHGGISDQENRLLVAKANSWDSRVTTLESWYRELI